MVVDPQLSDLRDLKVRTTRGGEVLEILFAGKKAASVSLPAMLRLLGAWGAHVKTFEKATVDVVDEAVGETTAISNAEIAAFAEAYDRVRSEWGGAYPLAGSKRFAQDFVKAAALAKSFDLPPRKFILKIVHRLTDINGGETKLPWPTQCHGETAAMFIQDTFAARETNPVIAAVKEARSKRNRPIGEDERYQDAKARVRKGRHDEVDLAYLRARQVAEYGAPKDWIATAEQQLEDRRSRK